MTENNYFTSVDPGFKRQLTDFKEKIMKLKLVKMRNGQKKTFSELKFIFHN